MAKTIDFNNFITSRFTLDLEDNSNLYDLDDLIGFLDEHSEVNALNLTNCNITDQKIYKMISKNIKLENVFMLNLNKNIDLTIKGFGSFIKIFPNIKNRKCKPNQPKPRTTSPSLMTLIIKT